MVQKPYSTDISGDDNSTFALTKLREIVRLTPSGSEKRLPSERALAEELGVSRRALRRALEALEAEGAIWRRQGSGTYIGPRPDGFTDQIDAVVAETDFLEIMEVRLRIEPQLAQLAAMRARPADIARMRELAERIAASEDTDAHELWDGALHRLIAKSARNQLFLTLFDMVNRVRQDRAWRSLREQVRRRDGHARHQLAQHLAIVDAIAAHNANAAAEAMRSHLLATQERLIRQTSLDHLDEPRAEGSGS